MSGRSLRRSMSIVALALVAAPLHAETFKVKAGESIQDAVNLALADGDIVQVAKGVYNENVVMSVAGVTLKGSSATINGGFDGNCLTITANNVTVTGMILVNGGGVAVTEGPPDTGGVLATGDGITLSKLTVNSCEDFGIRLVGVGGTVENCKVDACLVRGIDVSTGDPEDPKSVSGTLTTINKNTVTRCENGIRLEKGPFTVTSNTVTFCSDEGMEVILGLGETAGTTVTKNKANNNNGTGIIVDQPDEPGVNVVVEKNTMDENDVGLRLEGGFIDATSNTITDSARDGIQVSSDSCTLDKNKSTNSGGFGILVQGNTSTLTKNTVQNSGSDGIFISGNTNTLDGNTVKDGEGDGIQIAAAVTAAIVANCTVSGNEHDGIDNSGLLTILNGNNSKSNGGADIAGAGDGTGTVNAGVSVDNKVSDDSDLTTFATAGELDMLLP